jgi:hypothetical protein
MTDFDSQGAKCVACSLGDDEVPLIPFRYGGEERFICVQHLPALIHEPSKLIGLLPGAENLRPAGDGEDS